MDQALKDKLTNYCGLVLLIAGAIVGVASAGVALPASILTIATVAAAVAGSVIGWATGKLPTVPVGPDKGLK